MPEIATKPVDKAAIKIKLIDMRNKINSLLFGYALFESVAIGGFLMMAVIRMAFFVYFLPRFGQIWANSTSKFPMDITALDGLGFMTEDSVLEHEIEKINQFIAKEGQIFWISLTESTFLLVANICIIYATKNAAETPLLKKLRLFGIAYLFTLGFLLVTLYRTWRNTLPQTADEFFDFKLALLIVVLKTGLLFFLYFYAKSLPKIEKAIAKLENQLSQVMKV